ncbi:uncharacterized [Tachysurus ichikawai]
MFPQTCSSRAFPCHCNKALGPRPLATPTHLTTHTISLSNRVVVTATAEGSYPDTRSRPRTSSHMPVPDAAPS